MKSKVKLHIEGDVNNIIELLSEFELTYEDVIQTEVALWYYYIKHRSISIDGMPRTQRLAKIFGELKTILQSETESEE